MVKKENQNQKQTDSTEHIHKNQKWIKKARINAQKKLTPPYRYGLKENRAFLKSEIIS